VRIAFPRDGVIDVPWLAPVLQAASPTGQLRLLAAATTDSGEAASIVVPS
jgi:hypothetical protein